MPIIFWIQHFFPRAHSLLKRNGIIGSIQENTSGGRCLEMQNLFCRSFVPAQWTSFYHHHWIFDIPFTLYQLQLSLVAIGFPTFACKGWRQTDNDNRQCVICSLSFAIIESVLNTKKTVFKSCNVLTYISINY